MQNRDRFKSSIGFTDLLFNLVIGFVYLFIIAFILINPVAKNYDIPKKAEYLIIIEWTDTLNDDVDLWVKDPRGNTVSFVLRHSGLMHLEKDDLGHSNDVYQNNKGDIEVLNINREVVTLRGTHAGEYQVMAHVYNRGYSVLPNGNSSKDFPGTVTVSIVKVNPYNEMYITKYNYAEKGQQISLVRFRLDDDGEFVDFNNQNSQIITKVNRNNPSTDFGRRRNN